MDRIREIVGAAGVDVVITACPAGITHRQGLELLYKKRSDESFRRLPGKDNYYLESNLIHYKEASIFGAHASTVAQNRQAMEAVADGSSTWRNISPSLLLTM